MLIQSQLKAETPDILVRLRGPSADDGQHFSPVISDIVRNPQSLITTFPGGPKTLSWELLHYFYSGHNFLENKDPWCDNYEHTQEVMRQAV